MLVFAVVNKYISFFDNENNTQQKLADICRQSTGTGMGFVG